MEGEDDKVGVITKEIRQLSRLQLEAVEDSSCLSDEFRRAYTTRATRLWVLCEQLSELATIVAKPLR